MSIYDASKINVYDVSAVVELLITSHISIKDQNIRHSIT